jgi:hypothetical protein
MEGGVYVRLHLSRTALKLVSDDGFGLSQPGIGLPDFNAYFTTYRERFHSGKQPQPLPELGRNRQAALVGKPFDGSKGPEASHLSPVE